MLSAEQNDLITRTGAGTPAGGLMRCYWQPAALVDELAGNRPIKPVRLFGEDLVIFKDETGRYGLIGRRCPHRGTDLAYGRLENGGLRCSTAGCSTWTAAVLKRRRSLRTAISAPMCVRNPIPWWRRVGSCSPISAPASRRHFRTSTALSRRRRTPSRSRE